MSLRELVEQIVDRHASSLTNFEGEFCRDYLDRHWPHPSEN